MGLSYSVQAQEYLTGIAVNAQIAKEAQQLHFLKKSKFEQLFLPFIEDFSNYTGYPNEKFFIDKQAFVNNTFPVFPPSIGVVTLDALNEYGEIYPHLTEVSKGADTLTSRYIHLDWITLKDTIREITIADSLYFSFYFQPGGAGVVGGSTGELIGNQPEINDSLVLEFAYYDADKNITVWNHIWSTPGFSVNKWTSENPLEYFKQVMIPITDEKYLNPQFQFRFRNYASLEPQLGIMGWQGNVDQWHIDYIRLDIDRNYKDVFTNDLAFVSPTTSFLKNYQAMPWKQFQPADMKSNFTNQLTNLSDGVRASTYKYFINQNEEYQTGVIDIDPYFTHGIQKKESQAAPAISFTPNYLTDNTTFRITHIFQNAAGVENDFRIANDTCVFEQKFQNYYAYDDGTAEYGYCLNNQYNIAFLAMKYTLRVPDSLSALHMWFNHTKNSENKDAQFTIFVWKDDNGQPDINNRLYILEGNKPDTLHFSDFAEYKFDKKILVGEKDKGTETIWVGFEQKGNVQLNIGFDQNNDAREFFKYNTNGNWTTSAFRGAPMLRPVFGNPLNVSVPTHKISTIKIAPNPANDRIEITNYELRIKSVEIYDVMGRKQLSHTANHIPQTTIDVSHLSAGIYFVRIYSENNTIETVKLIKN
jgi:hypothetical protein